MPSISLQSEFGPRPAAGHPVSLCRFLSPSCFQTKPLSFTIEPENSHQCSGFVCAQFNTQSLYLQCAIDKMPSSEEHPLCVSLLEHLCCPWPCVALGYELEWKRIFAMFLCRYRGLATCCPGEAVWWGVRSRCAERYCRFPSFIYLLSYSQSATNMFSVIFV